MFKRIKYDSLLTDILSGWNMRKNVLIARSEGKIDAGFIEYVNRQIKTSRTPRVLYEVLDILRDTDYEIPQNHNRNMKIIKSYLDPVVKVDKLDELLDYLEKEGLLTNDFFESFKLYIDIYEESNWMANEYVSTFNERFQKYLRGNNG